MQVYIGDDLVHKDYMDDRPINYNATSVAATISGRSHTENLIDCSPAMNGYDFLYNSFSTSFGFSSFPAETTLSSIIRAGMLITP